MNPNFNYKTVYLFLLSLFSLLLIFSDKITAFPSKYIAIYSVIGIIACIVSWIVDESIFRGAEEYMARFSSDLEDHNVQKMLNHRITNLWVLFAVLLAVLIGFVVVL